jgi:hypothetical protein
MPGIISTRGVNDGSNTAFPGGLRMFDVSGTGAGPWVPVSSLYDPVSGAIGTIKPASTAPVATDPALVVALSPNGVARAADGSGNLLTSTAGAIDVNIKTGVNGNGRALPGGSAPVVLNSMTYQTVAVSTTQQCGATGASGDYLDGVWIIPGTAAAGVVQIKDGSGTAFNIFAGGGTTALPTLAPFFFGIGAISSGGVGGWKVITNANVTAVAVGNFT